LAGHILGACGEVQAKVEEPLGTSTGVAMDTVICRALDSSGRLLQNKRGGNEMEKLGREEEVHFVYGNGIV